VVCCQSESCLLPVVCCQSGFCLPPVLWCQPRVFPAVCCQPLCWLLLCQDSGITDSVSYASLWRLPKILSNWNVAMTDIICPQRLTTKMSTFNGTANNFELFVTDIKIRGFFRQSLAWYQGSAWRQRCTQSCGQGDRPWIVYERIGSFDSNQSFITGTVHQSLDSCAAKQFYNPKENYPGGRGTKRKQLIRNNN
jgi:hypothetical protein